IITYSRNGNYHDNQKDALDDSHFHFDIARSMILHADIISAWIAGTVEAEQGVGEIGKPTDEQNDHQPMDVNDEIVHLRSVFGGENGQSKKFFHIENRNQSRAAANSCSAAASCSSASVCATLVSERAG